MHPLVPKTEGETARIIDNVREQYSGVQNYDPDWTLPKLFFRAVLISTMTGAVREYYEQLCDKSEVSNEELIERSFEYATRKRLDHKKLDPDHMDVSGISGSGNSKHSGSANSFLRPWGQSRS